jgi:hypothetical protein
MTAARMAAELEDRFRGEVTFDTSRPHGPPDPIARLSSGQDHLTDVLAILDTVDVQNHALSRGASEGLTPGLPFGVFVAFPSRRALVWIEAGNLGLLPSTRSPFTSGSTVNPSGPSPAGPRDPMLWRIRGEAGAAYRRQGAHRCRSHRLPFGAPPGSRRLEPMIERSIVVGGAPGVRAPDRETDCRRQA